MCERETREERGWERERVEEGKEVGRRAEHEVIIWRDQTFQRSSVTAIQPPEDVNKRRQ